MSAWTDCWVVGEKDFSFCAKHICAFRRIKITFLLKFPVNSTNSQNRPTIAFCFTSQSILTLKSLTIYHQIQLLGSGYESKRQSPDPWQKRGNKGTTGPGKRSDPKNQKMLVQKCYSLITILLEGYLGFIFLKHLITDVSSESLISPSCSWVVPNPLHCTVDIHYSFIQGRETWGSILLTLKTPTFNAPQVCHVHSNFQISLYNAQKVPAVSRVPCPGYVHGKFHLCNKSRPKRALKCTQSCFCLKIFTLTYSERSRGPLTASFLYVRKSYLQSAAKRNKFTPKT